MKRDTDTTIYVLVACLTFANATTMSPQDWHFWTNALLAGLVVWKAKRSKGKENE